MGKQGLLKRQLSSLGASGSLLASDDVHIGKHEAGAHGLLVKTNNEGMGGEPLLEEKHRADP